MTEPVELSGSQCLELLERHGVGRIAFSTPLGPRIAPVRYTLQGTEILFRVTPFSEVGTYAPGTEVAFEVDEVDAEGHCGCSVVALGRADVVEPRRRVHEPARPSEEGPGAARTPHRWIRVRTHDFSGLRVDV